ncbi:MULTISPECIES: CHASE4 domain-containing protein [Sphingomonas]|uniref:CHASE4 domain-containing protein n=1 Tax=Sphingomonas TaxID=13687 RepID=UPI000A503C2A|nr:CHASE4 domain-containing protein [Sphingomonas sp. CCH10-B3]
MPALRFALPRRRPGSLGAKLLLILTAVGLLGSVAITLLLAAVITPSFNQLEAASVDAHVARTHAALNENIAKVETAVRDYGDWNSSYDYMGHPTSAFEKESFSTLAMANLDVSGMAYIGNDGRVVIARWLDLARGADYPAMRQQLIERIRRIDFKRAVGNSNSSAFYARVGDVVAAVGVAQVRRSDGSGAPRGYVLMVRQITSQQLSKLLQIGARLDPAQADRPVVTPSRSKMTIGVPILGADGHAVASVSFTVPREVSTLGTRMLLLAIIGSTVLLMVLLVVLSRAIARLVLAPLNRVERHMHVVTASGSLSLLQGEEERRDEIGSLGRSFNKMLRQLKDLREQLEVQSFALGKTESAVAVMHNVRNALNPISTILSRGLADAPPADKAMIDRALGELARDDIPAARRQKLAAFVAAAIEAEEAARSDRARQLKTGREAMQHVLEIIGTQQAQAHERPPLDTCDVTDLIAQNATIARYSGETSIAFEFPARPWLVMANRIILSQVIGNLFGNAAEAIAAKGTGSGSIRVAVSEEDGVVKIVIRDDGEGFSPEVGATLFQRGYSTRQHKSGGLGLHWCANSMNAMEGSLRLESEGKGLGATATLTLKAAPAAEARAAA